MPDTVLSPEYFAQRKKNQQLGRGDVQGMIM